MIPRGTWTPPRTWSCVKEYHDDTTPHLSDTRKCLCRAPTTEGKLKSATLLGAHAAKLGQQQM